jgi:hypothetical protein
MSPRRIVQVALVALGFGFGVLSVSATLKAQDAQPPLQDEVDDAKFRIVGRINGNAVMVRSGPSENDYATMRLDRDAEVTVVGEKFGWLKIVPPEGSFCYVAEAYVNRTGNGSFGQVTSTLNVRVGSSLNALKTKVASRLEPNQRVEIIGKQDEYFKIKPPADVFLYVNKQFVDPVRELPKDGLAEAGQEAKQEPAARQDQDPQAGGANTGVALEEPTGTDQVAEGPTTVPTESTGDAVAETTPATQPGATPSAEAEFDRLEATYSDASQRPLDEQPVEEMLASYQKLAASMELPESMRRICEFKINVLKTRAELKTQFVEARKVQDDLKSKQTALQGEQQELEQRIRSAEMQFYTAVGTLRPSSLQVGQHTLYRLTDPSNGRTVVYLRSDDTKLPQFIGQFVGVRGEVTTDSQLNLRIISPTEFEMVNPGKIGQNIVAQIVPPSLLPGGTQTADIKD